MGIYVGTYLCRGTFRNRFDAEVIDKLNIGGIDHIIEISDWEQGFVSLDEVIKYYSKTCSDQIEYFSSVGTDLFMMETAGGIEDTPSTRYILIKNDYSFSSSPLAQPTRPSWYPPITPSNS